MLTKIPLRTNPLRDTITNAYRMDEAQALNQLLPVGSFSQEERTAIAAYARELILGARATKNRAKMESLLQQYDLSTDEGIALMCLAEALLRIPDKYTMDKLISDKISTSKWKSHLSTENSLFVNAATWSLFITGKLFSPKLKAEKERTLANSLTHAVSHLGATMVRPVILQMMKSIGNQFVLGQTIEEAQRKAQPLMQMGYLFSYDMLGEASRTMREAQNYFNDYLHTIDTIGKSATRSTISQNPSISVKLSALNPRFEYTQKERLLEALNTQLLALAQEAKRYNIGLVVDAEETDRLDITLDVIERVFAHPSLAGWEGFGLAIQAYQKRTFYVIDWLAALAKAHGKRIITRLVKGAYWDSEIKSTQVLGFKNYPVFTRKTATDLSYIACARKMLEQNQYIYSQFGTHNAYSIAAVCEIAKSLTDAKGGLEGILEFECLQGMGRPLYDQLVNKYPSRIYAPVGSHDDLLGYLVRRLLENGANSSFLNMLADTKKPVEKMLIDPAERISALSSKPNPKIPLPKAIYGAWENSQGIDLSDSIELSHLKTQMDAALKIRYTAASLINGQALYEGSAAPVLSPADQSQIVGYATNASDQNIEQALKKAAVSAKDWDAVPVTERALLLENAANLIQAEMPNLLTLLSLEGGKCIADGMAEIREGIDYCRYYAYQARLELTPKNLPSPTGESNQLFLHGRGVVACISPWNFPVAIFLGQIVAALVAGNAVIAKPAEQTPLIAFKLIQLLHKAGIPNTVLQLVLGRSDVGAKIVKDSRIAGVLFTGSTEVAKSIAQTLAARPGPIPFLVAETGGQNAMIVDSSALLEQTVLDITQSAFNSAGQRCSALRVLFVQEEIAPRLFALLQGYMAELHLGSPQLLSTDIGPVIDQDAYQMLTAHFEQMSQAAKLIAKVQPPQSMNGYFFSPCAFEIADLSLLKKEVFGPILHIIRYPAQSLNEVMAAIINTGYGLTLGIQSRIDTTIQRIVQRMPVGNIYVNRNMIGAVVGVQPFGGEHLSGTGPKAGGPHYLTRLCIERSVSMNTAAVGGNARLISLLEED